MTCVFDDFDVAEEHVPLLDKWLYEGLSEDEQARIPTEVRERFAAHLQKLVDEGLRSAEKGGFVDGPTALQEMRDRLLAKKSDSRK